MKLPSYRVVEDIPAPEGVVTPEGDRVMMVDLASASLRESALRERIRGLEKHHDVLQRRVTYWYNRYSDVMSLHEDENAGLRTENSKLRSAVESLTRGNIELQDENAELKKVQEDLIKRAIERILNETT